MKKLTDELNKFKYLNEGEMLSEDAIFELFNDSEDDELMNEGELFEDDDDVDSDDEEETMSEEDLKIESLKIATNIAKLMSDVTTDDIITIADKVSDFIRNHEIGEEESDDSDESIDSEDTEESSSKENDEEDTIDFEVPEEELSSDDEEETK